VGAGLEGRGAGRGGGWGGVWGPWCVGGVGRGLCGRAGVGGGRSRGGAGEGVCVGGEAGGWCGGGGGMGGLSPPLSPAARKWVHQNPGVIGGEKREHLPAG